MSCKICGRGSCARWMYSAEQQEAWSLVESMDDRQLKSEVVDLRGEVAALKAEIADEAIALRDMMSERDAAEAELAKERARFVRFITLADTWQQGINDTQRVIENPEAQHRAGVLEINRLRTVNDVRRDMLKELLNTTKEDGK